MGINKLDFDTKKLWEGCILASIAHAIMVAHYPELSNEHSWDDINYNVQGDEGARGTITFHETQCIGGFSSFAEKREIDYKNYFRGASSNTIELAEKETLQYLLEEINGKTIPFVATAFWSEAGTIVSNDSYDDFIKFGGFLIENQLLETEKSIRSWKDYYAMNEKQINLLKSIYERKILKKNEVFSLTKDEVSLVGSDNEEGLEESKISFQEIGITWN